MATKVTLKIPPIPVQYADVEFEVRVGDDLLGTLKISRGSIDWFKKNARIPSGRASWAEFADWIVS